MSIAYGTIAKSNTGEYILLIVATYNSNSHPIGFKGAYPKRKDAKAAALSFGIDLTLPSLPEVKGATAAKQPFFFSKGATRTLDRAKYGAHSMKVVRGADGTVHVTNGRSSWVFDGSDLHRIVE